MGCDFLVIFWLGIGAAVYDLNTTTNNTTVGEVYSHVYYSYH